MSQFQYPHPWTAGYAIPRYVEAEPQGRGVFVTKQLPRGTFGPVPKDRQVWDKTKWATPKYAQGRYGKTAMTTKMLPRRTVGLLAPDPFARPLGSLDGSTVGGSSLSGNTLGAHAEQSKSFDPILEYGKQSANWIVGEVMRLPKDMRKAELKGLFDAINPGLFVEVEKKAEMYQQKGHKPREALRRAIAASLANDMVEDFKRLGAPAALSGFWSTVGSAVTKPFSLAAKGVKKLGGIACSVAKTPAGVVAGGAAGGPAGAAGVQVAAGMCPAGSQPMSPPMASGSGTSGLPLVPIAIGAGALILVLALK
jgi:hypothetical protein